MAGKKENLISPQELNARLTPEARSKNARKAGIKSVEVRKEKKIFKEAIRGHMILTLLIILLNK